MTNPLDATNRTHDKSHIRTQYIQDSDNTANQNTNASTKNAIRVVTYKPKPNHPDSKDTNVASAPSYSIFQKMEYSMFKKRMEHPTASNVLIWSCFFISCIQSAMHRMSGKTGYGATLMVGTMSLLALAYGRKLFPNMTWIPLDTNLNEMEATKNIKETKSTDEMKTKSEEKASRKSVIQIIVKEEEEV